MTNTPKIVVVGLGYVGLPLGVALAKHFDTIGLDIDVARIAELKRGEDRTNEIKLEQLRESSLALTADPEMARGADVYIVTVPTPVDKANRPDLSAVISASRTVAALIEPAKRPTVVYESTVYPGVTEDLCSVEIERASGLARGRDFRLGYSPERINPGDREHTVDKITKVISGEDAEVVEQLAAIYGAVTSGGVFRAASIKAAEAAKVIENAQRDINIAFMNEVAQIVGHLDVSVWDVLAAAKTKWNFLPFEPGLVGGHCIGVDPYYLSYLSQSLGHEPHVILAGRGINDGMGAWIADRLHEVRNRQSGTVLALGLTFKENVPDLRNSRVIDVIGRLAELGHEIDVTDPIADPDEVRREYGLTMSVPNGKRYDLVVGAVAHAEYRSMTAATVSGLVADGGTLADIKGMWRGLDLEGTKRWSL
ncbi:MAG: nucleotide sugar dehydrogenase [Pseudomonadota bacterium]|nr:nucleotide sugar dehydrogenase [Pseudomonadota bacterium]